MGTLVYNNAIGSKSSLQRPPGAYTPRNRKGDSRREIEQSVEYNNPPIFSPTTLLYGPCNRNPSERPDARNRKGCSVSLPVIFCRADQGDAYGRQADRSTAPKAKQHGVANNRRYIASPASLRARVKIEHTKEVRTTLKRPSLSATRPGRNRPGTAPRLKNTISA